MKHGQSLIQPQRCSSFGTIAWHQRSSGRNFNSYLSVPISLRVLPTHSSAVNGMAAMATIVKPLGGAIPVANGGLLPIRTTSPGNCKPGWVRSSRRGCQLRFVVRASDEGLVGQTPTSPVESGTEPEAGNLATELKTPSLLQSGGSMEEPGVGQTPSSPIESEPSRVRKPSPLQKGGTLDGDDAAGKDPAATTLGKKAPSVSNGAGKFDDPRWRAGTWDITKFTRNGKIDWDAVIDAGEPHFLPNLRHN